MDLTSVAPLRDLSPCSVPNIISILSSWHSQATEGLLAIESKICEVKDTAAERQRGEKEWKDVFEKALDSAGKEGPGGQIMGAVLGDKKGRKGGSILDNLTGGLKGPFSGGGSSAASGAKRDGTEMEGVISDGGNKRSAGGVNPRRSGN